MFFVLLFLILSATAAYVFPEWSVLTVGLASFACVAILRIGLALAGRAAAKNDR